MLTRLMLTSRLMTYSGQTLNKPCLAPCACWSDKISLPKETCNIRSIELDECHTTFDDVGDDVIDNVVTDVVTDLVNNVSDN